MNNYLHAHHIPAFPMPNYFDALVVVVLLWGLNKGRKHGMSEELMMTLQWVVIICAGAFLYKPGGDWLAQTSPVSHLFCYIAIYVSAAIVTKIFFSVLKKATGGKLVGSDVFGASEYYLGMVAGAVRYACMLIALLAVLNAPRYSAQDMAASKAFQNDLYGNTYYRGIAGLQEDVFKDSLVGSLVKQRASILLIASTKFEHVGVKRAKDHLP